MKSTTWAVLSDCIVVQIFSTCPHADFKLKKYITAYI